MDREELSLNSAIPFAGRYILKKLLGSGGMGAVYLAADSMLGDDEVALKILHSELCQNDKHTKRFLREVQLTRKVTHPNVVRTFDAGRENGRLYFTMEYAQGVALKEKLAAGPLEIDQCSSIIREISKGLYAIHQADIIHRDLKPGNVLLTPDGFIKITDFGVAKPGISDLTGHNEVIGSIPYMAPEVWVGRNVGPQADFYALGILAYEMVTGVLPFDGDSPAEMMCKHLESIPVAPIELRKDMPHWLNELILKMLQKDQRNRVAGAEEIVKCINELSDNPLRPAAATATPPAEFVESEERLELEDSDFGTVAPPTLDAPKESVMERVWAGRSVQGTPKYVKMPRFEQPEQHEFAGLSVGQRVARHAGVFIGCFAICALVLWRFHNQTALWLGATWSASEQVPILGRIVTTISMSFAFYAVLFAMPVFLLTALRRRVRACFECWLRAAVFMFFLLSLNFAAHLLQTHVEASKDAIPFTAQQLFSSAEAAVLNTAEVALLMPRGTTYEAVQKSKAITLVESPASAPLALLPYWTFLCIYLVYLMRVVEKDVLASTKRSHKFRRACFILFGVVPLFSEFLFLSVATLAQQLFAIRDVGVNIGVSSHLFDRYSLTCAALNWLVLACAVTFVVPFCLAQLHRRRQ